MGACMYGISFGVFNSISHERVRYRVEHEKRNSIPKRKYVSFFYHINTIALNRQENWTSDLGLRMVNALPFIHQPDSAALKAIEVSAAD